MCFGYVATVPENPILGPPKPVVTHWTCAACDVGWKDYDPTCWACGSPRHVAEYGSAAAQALRNTPT